MCLYIFRLLLRISLIIVTSKRLFLKMHTSEDRSAHICEKCSLFTMYIYFNFHL